MYYGEANTGDREAIGLIAFVPLVNVECTQQLQLLTLSTLFTGERKTPRARHGAHNPLRDA